MEPLLASAVKNFAYEGSLGGGVRFPVGGATFCEVKFESCILPPRVHVGQQNVAKEPIIVPLLIPHGHHVNVGNANVRLGLTNEQVATDFFCKTVWTPMGKHVAYVLTFVHLGSRKVFTSPSTLNPTDEWMRQQARNVSMWAEEEGIDVRFLIHDRDTKFTEAFDEHFRREKGGVVLTPYGAPVANSFVESWIGSLKRECLNTFFCFSLRQLDHIVQAYVLYHNKFRPHQGLGNRPLGTDDDPPRQDIEAGPIRRQRWLGGLLSHYYRKAA